MWGKVSCLRKQHDGRDWALNHRPSDLKSNVLTTTPLRPHSRDTVRVHCLKKQKQKWPGFKSRLRISPPCNQISNHSFEHSSHC